MDWAEGTGDEEKPVGGGARVRHRPRFRDAAYRNMYRMPAQYM